MEPLPSTGSVGALALQASQLIRQTPKYFTNDDLRSIVSHFEDFEGIFQALSSIIGNIHPERNTNWRRMFLKHGQRFNDLVGLATNLAEQLSTSEEKPGIASELLKVRKELEEEKSSWNLMLTTLNTQLSSVVSASATTTSLEIPDNFLRRRGTNQTPTAVRILQIQGLPDRSPETNVIAAVETHRVTNGESHTPDAGRAQVHASANSGLKVPEHSPVETHTVINVVNKDSHNDPLSSPSMENLIKKAIKEALEEYKGQSRGKLLEDPSPHVTGRLDKRSSIFYPYKRRFFKNMIAVPTVLTINALLLFAALCVQVVSTMKQHEERRQRKWGDADSLTAIQNLITQLLGLYTTFITVIDDDHLFSRLGWPSWAWIFLGTSCPIASLVVYEAFGWVTPLLSFGGTIGNAFLGVILLNIITTARKQWREESIQGIPLSNVRIVLNDELDRGTTATMKNKGLHNN